MSQPKESELEARARAAQKELSIAKRTAAHLEPLGRDAAKRVLAHLAGWFDLEVTDKPKT